ncbi:DNA topoisomerase 1 alpha-like isoform X1 [Ziziphus jujuba]|uniref:DNA topoisomerase I n=1 Tax=Ziziphus jujuba TaxID=326968 RepID=A0ABM3IFW3_ZIZJJ|nr:DNA topoisomerase 1 alpha-like isoform X1 [Ziziphus jujuba]XP_048327557.1 DNA topoisomerase 1 alpha-like isoform X1 [Ziziphus jujuba var. spinosa]XP_048327558.1 DNA topoisomerase 1 alpha-like isoform X1 [Ziziphus jujuba]
MAVETSAKPNLVNEYDDDDGPVIFKRSNASSKPNQVNSEVKKSPLQRNDIQSGRQISDVHSRNGLNSNSKGKLVSFTKASPIKSPAASQKASTLSAKTSPVRSPVNANSNSDSEDSEDDDKPLSARLKENSNHANKGLAKPKLSPGSSQPAVSKNILGLPSGDSDDEPLSSRFQMKSNAGTSGSKLYDADEKKPLVSKNQHSGSTLTDKQKKPLAILSKRPLDKNYSSDQSLVKKPKLVGSPTVVKSKQVTVKAETNTEDDDHIPISLRMKKSPASNNKLPTTKKVVTKAVSSSSKKITKKNKKAAKNSKYSKSTKLLPSSGDGQKKWTTLVHNGVIFPPPYAPHGVKMLYNGKPVELTPEQEEVATMFAVMKDTEYVQKKTFRDNFWNDWRKLLGKSHVIQKLDSCDFTPIYDWYQNEKEKKKQLSTEEKKALKEEKLKQEDKYMWAIVDGVKEKVGNFRVEPPGLFRGRGEHPKSGKLKRRIRPRDVTINIGVDAPIPECPIPGERWKEVRHDNTVTWLAFWNDPINPKEFKYVFLAASSSLKGQSDKEKYEKARMLKEYIKNIRTAYTKDFTSKDVSKRQIAVATYLIDKLALRAGNEKDDDEADTVGCCTLKVENVKAIAPNKLEFNFLGKDSIRYENIVEVELPVYKAIMQFQTGKQGNDDLFDKLDTSKLNAHLKELMPGLTAKVFRTYNASITLDDMLNRGTRDGDVAEKIIVYQHANKEVAIICNHQRTISKSHSAQMTRLMEKISELQGVLKELKTDLDRAKKGKPPLKDADGKRKRNLTPEALERKMAQTTAKIEKMERDMKTKEDLKTVALGTSKINYLDPRITVAWCKRHEVPVEKIFNKSLLAKFAWAMDVDPDFRF